MTGDNIIDCEKLQCKLTELACAQRQVKARSNKPGKSTYESCLNCQQGTPIHCEIVKAKIQGRAKELCKTAGCLQPSTGKPQDGYCATHCLQIYNISKDGLMSEKKDGECKVKGCKKDAIYYGKCVDHAKQDRARTDDKPLTPKVKRTAEPVDGKTTFLLDMTEYPGLIETVKKAAKDNFRSMEMQMIYQLHNEGK